MRSDLLLAAAALGRVALAAPKCKAVASYEGNPLADVQMYISPDYAEKVEEFAIPNLTEEQARQARVIAGIPVFQWLDEIAAISNLTASLKDIRALNLAGASPPNAALFVVYNFPDRDCSAFSSAGELALAEDGLNRYKTEYIDVIRDILVEYSDVRTILAYEPDGLANLITNMAVEKCAGAADAYKASTVYAFEQLDLPNVALYVDAGHAGWLGWEGNLRPTAELYAELYKAAGSPKAVRGIVTNVSNYNGYNLTTPPAYTDPNPQWDESKYHAALAPILTELGYPAHFLVDQGRSGKQPGGREAWGNWCNTKDSGFGMRPTTETDTEILDAIVWVKPGGESDGTSDSTATRFDENCVANASFVPAPEAGGWFQEYFEMLLENANPPL